MKVQLQAVSLRMQALRSNEQMAVAMKGATRVCESRCEGLSGEADSEWGTAIQQAMGQMNRSLNLPQVSH